MGKLSVCFFFSNLHQNLTFEIVFFSAFSIRLSAQECLDHPWLRPEMSSDKHSQLLQLAEDSSTLSCNSTIVADDEELIDDQTDVGSILQDTLEDTIVNRSASPVVETSSSDCTPLSVASFKLVAFPKWIEGSKPKLGAVFEDSSLTSFSTTRRGNSLPFRFRAPVNRRETSCDRTSDLGYGSDGISEISSADSSSDRSSIISLDDAPPEWTQPAVRRYSDTSLARRTWERFLPTTAGVCVGLPQQLFRKDFERNTAANHETNYRPWERICTGSRARALERFNSSPPSNLPSPDLSKSLQSLALRSNWPAVKVPEVRTRLLRSPSCSMKSPPPLLPIKPAKIQLDKTETVRSRVVKFQSVSNSTTAS